VLAEGAESRTVALAALDRIESEGAYANLVLRPLLADSKLDERDRAFVTELVYGTTRMRRACDFLVDRYLAHPPPPVARQALRLGAYQLAFADVAPHAAVAATVEATPLPLRGVVNAVLRKVASAQREPIDWPDDATRLSVPDWIVDRLTADLGQDRAVAALTAMNESATATVRPDGYVQDVASQLVVDAVGVEPGDRVLDVASAPGGKTTGMATDPATRVVAADVHPRRLGLVRSNADHLGVADRVALVAADGTRPPWRPGSFDRVLVDAPCSGLGTLRRRADLRWRVEPESVERLARLQRELVEAGAPLVRPGGLLVYSVCTLTAAESLGVDEVLAERHPELVPVDPPADGLWEPWGRGAIVLPQSVGSDGMCLFRYTRRPR
jgi:16S rRNA (cytosine967-C5)-methyltransferase